MTEPVMIQRGFLIAVLVVLQTLAPPLMALAALYVVSSVWHLAFTPSALAVTITLLVVVLIHPPRDLASQLEWNPGSIVFNALAQWLVLIGVLLFVGYSTGSLAAFPRRALLAWILATPIYLVAGALMARILARRLLASSVGTRSCLFAGYNHSSLELARRLTNNPSLRLRVEGFFDDRGADRLNLEDDAKLVGKLADIAAFAKERSVDVIFVALPMRHLQRVLDLLDDLRDTTASIYYVPDVFVFDLIQARSGEIDGIPVVSLCETPFYGMRGVSKRMMDIVVSLGFLICAAPLLLAIGIAVKLSSPGPAIFRQRRYGLDGEEIMVYKFRTMTVTEDGAKVTQASKNDKRITPIGGFLRKYSLDELPQFINVLQGRMSLVGPRPHAVAHNEEYRKLIKGYMVRHKVPPGITGLAQVNGARGETSKLEDMELRVKYDLDYLRHWSLLLDLKILVQTATKVFKDDKAY